MKTIKLN